MKTFFTIILFSFSMSIYSQQNNIYKLKEKTESAVTSLKYSVNSTEEFNDLNWLDIKNYFKNNKDEEVIKLSFEIDLLETKNKFKSSINVSGKTKDLNSLIEKTKKMLPKLIKISKNYENK